MTDFFTQLTEALEKENSRRPGMSIAAETLTALNSDPEKEVPPVQAVPEKTAPAAERSSVEPIPAAPIPADAERPQMPHREAAPVKKLVPGTLEHLCEK